MCVFGFAASNAGEHCHEHKAREREGVEAHLQDHTNILMRNKTQRNEVQSHSFYLPAYHLLRSTNKPYIAARIYVKHSENQIATTVCTIEVYRLWLLRNSPIYTTPSGSLFS